MEPQILSPKSLARHQVRAAFYVFLNVQNLVAISAAWARCADVFAPEAAARLFGVVSAGATVGQLAGSLVTAGVAGARVGTPASGPLYGLVLASALLMYGAAFFAAKVQRPAARRLADPPGAVAGDAAGHPGSAALDKDAPSGGATAHVAQLLQGFTMIARSPYLLMVCGYLMMTYIVGSLMYFQRSLVVATAVADSNARAAFFARLHSASAAAIICLQLTATGRLLRSAGVMFALAVFPCACAVLVAAVGWRPDTGVVALGEVARKLLGYVLVRPAREVLFTAVSREEKYRAKLTIDAVVQRLGDSLAALLFEVLDVRLQLGQHGVAAAGVAACMLWLYWSVQLGAQHTALTSGAGSVSVAQERRDFGGQEQAGPTAALTGRV
uniref:ADP,ATP carrier protein n=1 Tax=Chlamydomonas euryale TaxID=1486919 RepID=A0A7R9YTZ2_9CHLO